jgi:HAMP domain-containing protein
MSRLVVSLVLVLLIVVGALFFFAGRSGEKPTTRIEKAVELGNLAS